MSPGAMNYAPTASPSSLLSFLHITPSGQRVQTEDFIPVDSILRKSPNQTLEYEQTEKPREGGICPSVNAARRQEVVSCSQRHHLHKNMTKGHCRRGHHCEDRRGSPLTPFPEGSLLSSHHRLAQLREDLPCNGKEFLNDRREAVATPYQSCLDGDLSNTVGERTIDDPLSTKGHR